MQEMSSHPSGVKNLTGEFAPNSTLQTLELHRQAIIGKLVASIVHEINNPLQAIQGSATLALESIGDPGEVTDYLHLIQRESARILELTSLIRSIYAPQKAEPESFNLVELVQQLQPILQEDQNRRGIQLQIHTETAQSSIFAAFAQVQLALLGILLCLNQRLSSLSVPFYTLTISQNQNAVLLQFDLGVSFTALEADSLTAWVKNLPDLAFSFALLEQQQAKVELIAADQQAVLQVKFPPAAQTGASRD